MMARRRIARLFVIAACTVPLLATQTMARADVIGARQFIDASDRRATVERIDAVLARAEVRQELERLGVDSAHAAERVAALNDQELATLADHLEELPAGGLLGTIGVVFVVLLILELVGVIDIFNKI